MKNNIVSNKVCFRCRLWQPDRTDVGGPRCLFAEVEEAQQPLQNILW